MMIACQTGGAGMMGMQPCGHATLATRYISTVACSSALSAAYASLYVNFEIAVVDEPSVKGCTDDMREHPWHGAWMLNEAPSGSCPHPVCNNLDSLCCGLDLGCGHLCSICIHVWQSNIGIGHHHIVAAVQTALPMGLEHCVETFHGLAHLIAACGHGIDIMVIDVIKACMLYPLSHGAWHIPSMHRKEDAYGFSICKVYGAVVFIR